MNLYDVHTHTPCTTDDEEEYCRCILNVYPLGFEMAKEDQALTCLFSCGVHPWYAENAEPQIKFLKEIASDLKIVAIGEVGYDKLKGADLKIQKEVFETQVELSESVKKPLVVHCVKAWGELLESKKNMQPTQPWIVHGYRGKPRLTEQLLDSGFYFSIGTKFNTESLNLIPCDRMFCETDDKMSKIADVYKAVSAERDMKTNDLMRDIEQNVKNIFPQLVII